MVSPRGGPPILRRIDTSPVGFVVLDRLLLSVHPQDCSVRDSYIDRLFTANLGAVPAASATDGSSTGARASPPVRLI
jgi:hypothetical protein